MIDLYMRYRIFILFLSITVYTVSNAQKSELVIDIVNNKNVIGTFVFDSANVKDAIEINKNGKYKMSGNNLHFKDHEMFKNYLFTGSWSVSNDSIILSVNKGLMKKDSSSSEYAVFDANLTFKMIMLNGDLLREIDYKDIKTNSWKANHIYRRKRQ